MGREGVGFNSRYTDAFSIMCNQRETKLNYTKTHNVLLLLFVTMDKQQLTHKQHRETD